MLDGRAFRAGDTINYRFRVVRFLGQGGMGEVYEADDLTLKTRVALKTVRSDFAGNQEVLERFRREILLARKVTHPNVCRLFDVGTRDERGLPRVVFLTMELLDGETLSVRLARDGPFDTQRASPIVRQLASALDAAHAAGVVHRDFKTANVMLVRADDGSDRAVVTDFGLARGLAVESEGSSLLETGGGAIGTPAYMAPEQIEGKPAGPPADVYAFGVVLYEMLTGHRPYAESSPLALAAKKVREAPRPLTEFVPDLDIKWQAAILRCLSIQPADRFRDGQSVLAAIESPWSGIAYRLKPRASRRAALGIGALAIAIAVFAFWFWSRPANPELQGETARWYRQAREAMHAGASWRASELLERVTASTPRHALAHAHLAEAYAELDMLDRAKDELIKAAEAAPDRSRLAANDALAIDAAQATALREFPRAAGVYKKIADAEPADRRTGALLDLGRAYERANLTANAVESFGKALALDPQNAAGKLRLAILAGRQSNLPKAGGLFTEAESNYRLTGDFEGVAETVLQKGRTFRNARNLAEAKAGATQALDLAKTTGNVAQQVRARFDLATVLLLGGDAQRAVEESAAAVVAARRDGFDTLSVQGLIDLANAYLTQYRLKEAEALYRQAIEMAKRNRNVASENRASMNLASSRLRSGDATEAVRLVEGALPFYRQAGYRDGLGTGLTLLTDARIAAGQFKSARDSANELESIATAGKDVAQAAVAKERLAEILTLEGDFPAALALYQQTGETYASLGRKHQELYANANRADLLSRLGRNAEAARLLAEVDKGVAALGEGGHPVAVRVYAIRAADALIRRDCNAAQRYANQVLKEPAGGSAYRALDAQLMRGLAMSFSGRKVEGLRQYEQVLDKLKSLSSVGPMVAAKILTALARNASGDETGAAALARDALQEGKKFGMEEASYRAAWIANDRDQTGKSAALLRRQWGSEALSGYESRPDVRMLGQRK